MMLLQGTKSIETVEQLEDLLSTPPEAVIELMNRLEGDIILLGAGGKIGPSLGRMARRATDLAGVQRRVIGVSRFSSPAEEQSLRAHGVETIRCDLLDEAGLAKLPAVPNVIYLAGLKFGSTGNEAETWAMNAYLPGRVCRTFGSSRFVVYSTGAVYGFTPWTAGGSREVDTPQPVGEYSMSCLGRERVFEYFSRTAKLPVAVLRLYYACELRYGVLVDLARKIVAEEPIDLSMGHFNIIWQGDSNAAALLALEHAASPPVVLNVTGPELLSVREASLELGRRLGRKPKFCGAELETSCIGNAGVAHSLFGLPEVGAGRLLEWVAEWVKRGGAYLDKPTHFEARDGRY
jgi:nucleoside-diphosphate-sugar epimerase